MTYIRSLTGSPSAAPGLIVTDTTALANIQITSAIKSGTVAKAGSLTFKWDPTSTAAANTTIVAPLDGTSGKWVLNVGNNTALNIAALRTYIPGNPTIVEVQCYSTLGDGGGGTFYWDSSSAAADNNGTIIAPTGLATGRWKRQFTGAEIPISWFGAIADNGTTDNTAAFTSAIRVCNSLRTLLYVCNDPLHPAGEYWFNAGARLPRMDKGKGIIWDKGSPAALKFQDSNGDGLVLKYGDKIVRNANIVNLRTSACTNESAALRLINVNYGHFKNLKIGTGADKLARLMLEADYNTFPITGATNASPIVCSYASLPAGQTLEDGANINITGALGNTAANGNWVVTRVDDTHFSLNGSTGNGTWSSGGTVVETDDAYEIVHLGPWHNTFENLALTYLTSGVRYGSGIKFYINSRTVNVANPPGQSAGTYSGSIFDNHVSDVTIEDANKCIDLDNSSGGSISNNIFDCGSFIGGNIIIYGRGAAQNHFKSLNPRYWDYTNNGPFDMQFTNCDSNRFEGLSFFAVGPSIPYELGPYIAISAATNASPIVITSTRDDHGLFTGDTTTLVNVGGNTAANGTWTVIRLNATQFSLTNSIGNGSYTSGGYHTSWRNTIGAAGSWTSTDGGISQRGDIQRNGYYCEDGSGPGIRLQGVENDFSSALHKFRNKAGTGNTSLDLGLYNGSGTSGTIVLGSDGRILRVGTASWKLDDNAGGAVQLTVGSLWLTGGNLLNRAGTGAAFGPQTDGSNDYIATYHDFYNGLSKHIKIIDGNSGTLTTNASAASVITTKNLTASAAGIITFYIQGYRTGGAAAGSVGDSCTFVRKYQWKRIGSGDPLITSIGADITNKDDAAVGSPSIAAVASSATIQVLVTGAVNMNMTWGCTYEVEGFTV